MVHDHVVDLRQWAAGVDHHGGRPRPPPGFQGGEVQEAQGHWLLALAHPVASHPQYGAVRLGDRGHGCVRHALTLPERPRQARGFGQLTAPGGPCLLYTSDAADEEDNVDLGGRRIIKKKKKKKKNNKQNQKIRLNTTTEIYTQ